jgi:hypothetical protein
MKLLIHRLWLVIALSLPFTTALASGHAASDQVLEKGKNAMMCAYLFAKSQETLHATPEEQSNYVGMAARLYVKTYMKVSRQFGAKDKRATPGLMAQLQKAGELEYHKVAASMKAQGKTGADNPLLAELLLNCTLAALDESDQVGGILAAEGQGVVDACRVSGSSTCTRHTPGCPCRRWYTAQLVMGSAS